MNDIDDNEFPSAFDTALSSFTKNECLSIALSDNLFQSREEQNRLNLAVIYFKDNIDSFEKDELKQILSNNHFLKNLGKKFIQGFMQRCVHNGTSSPILFNEWRLADNKTLIHSYLRIINDEENTEQLNFFTRFHPKTIKEFIEKNNNVSENLSEIYLNADPLYIFSLNWSEEKIGKWLNNNQNILPDLALKTFNESFRKINTISNKIDSILLDSIGKKLLLPGLDNENIGFKIQTLMNPNISKSLFKKLDENYPNEYQEILSITVSSGDHPSVELNLAQYTALNRNFNSISEVKDFFENHHDLLLKPIKSPLYLYDQEISIFEHGLSKCNFMPFVAFSLDSDLDDKYKEQLVAGAFCLLQCKYGVLGDEYYQNETHNYINVLSYWFPQIIESATNKQVEHYSEKILKITGNLDIIREIDQIKLVRELNTDLSNNGLIVKKHKI